MELIRFFDHDATLCDQSQEADFNFDYEIEKDKITVKLIYNGQTFEGIEQFEEVDDELIKKRKEKYALKILVYKAMSSALNKTLLWGALSGIRPTKLARTFCNKVGFEKAKEDFKRDYLVSDEKTDLVFDTLKNQQEIIESAKPNDYNLYVAIPFCPSRCGYCSFGAYEIGKVNEIEQYIQVLKKEIEYNISILQPNYNIRSVYIGGGTPTALKANELEQIIIKIREALNGFDGEFTVEAGRPETLTLEMLRMLKNNDIKRISINPQTFNDKTLYMIGRNHTSRDTINAVELAKQVGFGNINMDIILALPDEKLADVKNTFAILKDLQPQSITVHTLAIKRTAKFKKAKESLNFANVEEIQDMINFSIASTKELGLVPYYLYRQKYMQANLENIGFCKPGEQCIYNIDTMEECVNIVACGAGAITKKLFGKGKIERLANAIDLKTYFLNQQKQRQKMEMLYQGGL